jgi:hypothetical protein
MHLSLNNFGDPCVSFFFEKGTKEIDKERKSVDEEIPSYYSIDRKADMLGLSLQNNVRRRKIDPDLLQQTVPE